MGRAAAGVGKRGRFDAGDRGNTGGQTQATRLDAYIR
jgi:hypothetical protein